MSTWVRSLGPTWRNQRTSSYKFSSDLQLCIVECVPAHTINKLDVIINCVKWEKQLMALDPCLRFRIHYGAWIVIGLHSWISTTEVPEGSLWASGNSSHHVGFLDPARDLAPQSHEAGCLGRSLHYQPQGVDVPIHPKHRPEWPELGQKSMLLNLSGFKIYFYFRYVNVHWYVANQHMITCLQKIVSKSPKPILAF